MATATVICETPGCPSEGRPVENVPVGWENEETGETEYVSAVACGACGQPITDVTPPIPTGGA